ncbi:S1 RNA-binding domain-containing protein [Streptomyces adonidis]|uniref:S1 RNA-binding domain-containing protein n=1 Tax=Streptomyces adonidis TaxID=3231367 RepID=UPI0034DAFC04
MGGVGGGASDDQACREFLEALRVGGLCTGTVTEVARSADGVTVTLDGFPARPLGTVGPRDLSWRRFPAAEVEVGQRITAKVLAVDPDEGRVELSMAAAENPELWAFLSSLRYGEILTGTIASIERYGVFVALDGGPDHPVFPGVGFVSFPELSWRRFESASEVVEVGQRVSCEFLQFDTWNGEARLSLRAMEQDPFQTFADATPVGRTLEGRVTRLIPFGVFVQVADGIEGLVPLRELAWTPVAAPEEVVGVGDAVKAARQE